MFRGSASDSYVCPVFGSAGRCGEQDALRVMEQFKDFYEGKLSEVDVQGGGDCMEVKLKIQRRWIEDLTEQTQMMARIVKELEEEATTRVRMLEDKLRQTSKSAYEVMKRYQTYSISHNLDEPFQKVFYLESDCKNLLEFVRRIRDDKKWSIDGLQFFDITYKDLFGGEDSCECNDKNAKSIISVTNGFGSDKKKETLPVENEEKSDENVKNQRKPTYEELLQELGMKTVKYDELRQSMLDMRSALTEEVAYKHDMISALKKDVQQLEERCLQADKQTAFKDDIIKELRKEIKQLKHEENNSDLNGGNLSESLQNIVGRVQNMKNKMKRFYNQRRLTRNRIKQLQDDNNSKQLLLINLYNIIKGLLNKLALRENKNKEKEADLVKQLEEAKMIIKRMRPCVDMKTACTGMDDDLVIKKSKLIQNKDDIIQIQNSTLNVIDVELQASRKREKDLEDEISRRQREVEELQCKCTELETSLASSQGRADNLQKAVDLYINSVNVLEATEQRARIEIEQQKMTIINLQEALVNVKQELDELRQSSQQEVGNYIYICNVFYANLLDLEGRNRILDDEISKISDSYRKLQDCCFDLEIEHFNVLQDMGILETRLHRYQSDFRKYESAFEARALTRLHVNVIQECARDVKTELKKLRQQNHCYERVVECFKHEMVVMSEQLMHLQEILNLSNQSCKEENGQLFNAVVELQKLSEKLQAELVDTEKKVLIENQRNQIKDAQIGELQMIIGQKNADLNVHDEAINDMKLRLENTLVENHELQNKVVSLKAAILQMQCSIQSVECERAKKSYRSKGVGGRRSLSDCTDQNERRNRRSERQQVEFADQSGTIRNIQRELERVREKNREKIKNLKRQNEELKDKLATSELSNGRLIEKLHHMKEQSSTLNERECCREHELAQSKQIILELRQTLIELNESLADGELHHTALAEELHKSKSREYEQEDIYLSCRCEIAMYKKLAEALKEALLENMKKVKEIEARNKTLKEELRTKEARMTDIHENASKKEKETCQCIEELTEKLKESQEEERRLSEFVEGLKQEVQRKIEQKKEARKPPVIKYCECETINATQEEISSLKIEIQNMIQNQLALNNENDKLLKQVTHLQTNVASLEDTNRYLKQKMDRLQSENQNLKEKNKALLRERETLAQTIRSLEMELTDTRNIRDDLCAESRCVVNNVKAWLEEQKKINDKVKKKTQCYCDTITKLKQENEYLSTGRPLAHSAAYNGNVRPCTPADCPGLWLGSQGTGSLVDSPRDSPVSCNCSMDEWYSPTYREDDETEDIDDVQFINTLETIANDIKSTNKKWQCGRRDCPVSRDKNK